VTVATRSMARIYAAVRMSTLNDGCSRDGRERLSLILASRRSLILSVQK
jgi:hypothetical protein